MMILLHGPGEIRKRDELLKIKDRFKAESIVTLEMQKSGEMQLKDVLRAVPLFDEEKLVVAENIVAGLDLGKALPAKLTENVNLVLVASSTLPASSVILKEVQKRGGRAMNFEAEGETSVFPYLDSLIEGRAQAYVELEKLQAEYGSMYLLSMICYLLRRNFLPLPASGFMRVKVKSQKEKVKRMSKWADLYRYSLETEYKIKKGILDEKLGVWLLTDYFLRQGVV